MKSIYTGSAVVLLAMLMFACGSCTADDVGGCSGCHPEIVENFNTSLHHTGAGMFDEYTIGAAGHFDIDMDEYYTKFKCSKCHASTCTQCHVDYAAASQWGHTAEANITIETCEPCHSKKQTSTYVGDFPMHKSQGPNADIHYERGLDCTDCHAASELHGTGDKYDTQLQATNVECEGCHKDVTESRSHTVHDDKLECISCHTGWMLTCENCHLDTRKGMTVTSEEFLLGINKDDKVTTFLIMNATVGNETHHAYGEWFSHTTSATGKECVFCHENPDVLGQGLSGQIVGEGGSLISQKTIDRVFAADISEPAPPGLIARIFERLGW